METKESVYELIKSLCKCFIKENKSLQNDDTKILRKCTSRAYEILLNKSPNAIDKTVDPTVENIDFQQFSMRIQCRNKIDHRRCDDFDKVIEDLHSEGVFEDDCGQRLISLLILLKDSIGPISETFYYHKYSLSQYGNLSEVPRIFRDIAQITPRDDNPYIYKPNKNNPFTAMIDKYLPTSINPSSLSLQPNHLPALLCHDNLSNQPKDFSTFIRNQCHHASKPSIRDINKTCWEEIETMHMPEIQFSSEKYDSVLHLLSRQNCGQFTAKLVSMSNIIRDTKALLIGIQSETYVYNDEKQQFTIVNGITVDEISPATFNEIITEFLECGTCFKRLSTKYSNKICLNTDGFVYRALCLCIQNYLNKFSRFIMVHNDETIMSLLLRVRINMQQLQMFAKFMGCTFLNPIANDIPRGSELLSYLYRAIIDVTQRDLTTLLFYILQQCCLVYFKNFEKWIFYGYIDDPCKELFIDFIDHYRINTKYYWDKAYLIKRHSAPIFLCGFEDLTLLCGKYTMLLKAYKPTHQMLTIARPELNVCLTYSDIEAMQKNCMEFSKLAHELCGKSISITNVFQQKAEKRKLFMKAVALKFQENMEKWKVEQQVKQQEIRQQQAETNIALQKQIDEIRERKLKIRRQNIAEDQEYLRHQQQLDDERLLAENVQRQKTIDYYKELGELVDKQRKQTDHKITKLKEQISREKENVDNDDEDAKLIDSESISPISPKSIYHSAENLHDDDNHKLFEVVNNTAQEAVSDDVEVINENYKLDLVNSNTTELLRNKTKVLGSSLDFGPNIVTTATTTVNMSTQDLAVTLTEALSDAQKNKIKVLRHEYFTEIQNVGDTIEKDSNRNDIEPMTERQRNKMKILGDDFQMAKNVTQPPPEIKVTQLTELQKNRQKVMAHEFGYTTAAMATNLNLNLNSGDENEVKRRKNIHPDTNNLIVTATIDTPMSTGSDTPMIEHHPHTNIYDDIKNANQPTLSSAEDIPISCVLPNLCEFVAGKPTPECALNTAGILAKDGFYFPSTSSSSKRQQLPLHNDNKSFSVQQNQRKHIFQQFFQINLNSTDDNTNNPLSEHFDKLSELKSLNITTITQYLQMSFVTPLQTYLNVLSNEILKMYICDFDILGHFNSLRKYFFMLDGEFGSYISDKLIQRLESNAQPTELLNYHILHMILDQALNSSIICNDVNAQNLSFNVDELPEKFDLKSPNVLKMLNLSYSVEWPLNLLLNPETILHYGKIFKYLLKLRRINWVLDKSYQILKETAKNSKQKILGSQQYRHVQQIRHKLLNFINALQNYITANALQSSWRQFKNDLETAQSMEDLYQKHTKYLKQVEFLCMINKRSVEFHLKLEDIFVIVLRFYYKLQARSWRVTADGTYSHPNFNKLLIIEQDFQKLIEFIIHMGTKMSRRGYQTEINDFINLINFNQYYNA